MIIDLNTIEASPFDGVFDLCVCGSGPAGMTVAREAAARGLRVVLLEAGGFEPSEASQEIYKARSIGALEYYGVETCRLRYFGGTSGHWAGRCAILDPVDFESRDIWGGLPGWPITHAEAYRRLDDARAILDIDDQSLAPRREPRWKSARFSPSGFARSAPTRFGEKFRAELQSSKKTLVCLNANVVSLELSDDKHMVRAVEAADWRDRRFKINARRTVIAFGSLENARFLLNMGALKGAPIGDQGGFAGRCFMEHFDIVLGRFTAQNNLIWRREAPLSVTLTAAQARAQGLGSAVVSLALSGGARHYGRLAPIRRLINDIECAVVSPDARSTICSGDGIATDIIEQAPNRDSRVTLNDSARDRFGHFRINVDWRLSAQDVKTIGGLAEEVGKAIAEQDVGRFKIADDILAGAPVPGFHCHQMGTTRMSADPKFGVVDADCRVHGMDNLYIAGSSVFPTGGGANPTTTIVALALRLGEHLAGANAR
ncbi:MAG: GMC family oxidoreductase [Parvularculaceae bacterium]|nr:GMC family oxidoreductase [Parvularculaceae bacterium]